MPLALAASWRPPFRQDLGYVGLGLGLLFAPASRAALNAVPASHHGRVSALLSTAPLLGAAAWAALGGLALSGGVDASGLRRALLVAAVLCVAVGVPAAWGLAARPPRRAVETPIATRP